MAELKEVYFGLEETPLPVGHNKAGEFETLASDDGCLTFQTLREGKEGISVDERLYFELMRKLPSRSMLPYLKQELTLRDPNRTDAAKKSYISGYIGAPSIGKSFAFKTLGKLTHPKGALMVNCKDVDMGTLFCETVFDTSAADAEKAAIDSKLMLGNKDASQGLQEQSIALLRNALGKAFTEEERNGKKVYAIDWNGIQVKGDTFEQQNYQKQVLSSCLKQVCKLEGIEDKGGAQSIGITTRDGAAVRVLDPNSADYGRPLLLDEINRCKPGTLQKLYEYTAMLADPKVDTCEVLAGGNRPVTLSRNAFPPTFRVNFTGNPATEGMGSEDMDKPFVSRLGVELDLMNLPDPSEADIADRIAGSLSGVPLTQLYYSNEELYKNDPNAFVEDLMVYRTGGLTEKEKAAIPQEEILNIQNAPKTLQVAEQMAGFFADIRQLTNPESALYKNSDLQLSQEYETYLKSLEIDLRLATKYMENASVENPTATTTPKRIGTGRIGGGRIGKPREGFKPQKSDMTERLATRGDRLEASLEAWMERIFKPGHAETLGIEREEMEQMYAIAKKIAAHHGIGDPELEEGKLSGASRLKDVYNVDRSQLPSAQNAVIREQVVDAIEKSAGFRIENPNEAISDFAINTSLKRAQERAAAEPEYKQVREMSVINDNVDTVADQPIVPAVLSDVTVMEAPMPQDLVPHNTFVGALAIPALSQANMKSLWNQSLSTLSEVDREDETVKIAENRSETGLGLTTLLTNDKGEAVITHVISDEKAHRTVIVSEDVDQKVQEMFARNSITYIDRKDPKAAEKINKEVEFITKGRENPDEVSAYLSGAMMLRDSSVGETIGEAMVASSTETVYNPIFVTKMEKRSTIDKEKLVNNEASKSGKSDLQSKLKNVENTKEPTVPTLSYAAEMRRRGAR
ncbi:MAG: hypothetical protein MJ247_01175 [Alphaproteobacteria bacterium]|nr:hypothetical protein [Alphaproteobacteria bacterium]